MTWFRWRSVTSPALPAPLCSHCSRRRLRPGSRLRCGATPACLPCPCAPIAPSQTCWPSRPRSFSWSGPQRRAARGRRHFRRPDNRAPPSRRSGPDRRGPRLLTYLQRPGTPRERLDAKSQWQWRRSDAGRDGSSRTRTRGRRSQPSPDMLARMSLDPVASNPEHYKVVFENERVRVLEYPDHPGDKTTPHQHPDSIMYTLSTFRRRLVSGDVQREVELQAGSVGWLPPQEHHGENVGAPQRNVLFVEWKYKSVPRRGALAGSAHSPPDSASNALFRGDPGERAERPQAAV